MDILKFLSQTKKIFFDNLISNIIILLVWALSLAVVVLLYRLDKLADYLSALNFFIIFGVTFSIGLFTYYQIAQRGLRDVNHKERILLFGFGSFCSTIAFIISLVLIQAGPFIEGSTGIELFIFQVAYSAGSLLLAISLLLFNFILIRTLIEFLRKGKDLIFEAKVM